MQNYFYDLHDQLVKAEIFKKDGSKETWTYSYDALGRRIGKGRLKNEEVSETSFPYDLGGNDLENQTRFVRDGSHLLQEIHPDGRYTYIYTIPTAMNLWHRYATTPMPKAKANRKPTTSTATKSVFRVR